MSLSSFSPAPARRHYFVSFGVFLVLGVHVGVWAVQLASLADGLRLDPGALGVALSGAAAGGILTLFAGGRIADRFGRRSVLITGFTATGAAFALLALVHDFAQVVTVVILYGLSISFIDLGANAVGSDYESAHGVHAMTGLQAGFSLGAALGALTTGVVLAAGVNYRVVYLGLAAVFAVAAAAITRVELPPTSSALSVPGGQEVPSEPLISLWRTSGVLFAVVAVAVTFFGDGALEGFLALFLRRALASGVLLSGAGVASYHVASLAGRLIADRVLRTVPIRVVIAVCGLLAAAGIGIAVTAARPWLAIAGLLLVGFAISPVVPSALSLAGRSAPGRSGQAVALTTAVGYSAFLISPLAVGAVADAAGLRAGLSLLVATTLLLAALGTRWPATRAATHTKPQIVVES